MISREDLGYSRDQIDGLIAESIASLDCLRLVQYPHIGHTREDFTTRHDVRFWPVYRPETKPIQILRIIHGKRDVKGAID